MQWVNILLIVNLLSVSLVSAQVTGPEQDCISALEVCQAVTTQSESYVGSGATEDLANISSCLQTKEDNSVWYTFTIKDSGELRFLIIPMANDDYDFALYNLTGGSCSYIFNDTPGVEVRCNYVFSNGPTGLDSNWISDSPVMAPLQVFAGETFALLINHFSATVSGYTLDFAASTATFIVPSSCNTVALSAMETTEVSILPNPAHSLLNINITSLSPGFNFIRLFSITGHELLWIQPALNSRYYILNTEFLPSGFYLCQVTLDNGKSVVKKVIIEK